MLDPLEKVKMKKCHCRRMRRVIERLTRGQQRERRGRGVAAANRLQHTEAAELEQNISINHKVIELFREWKKREGKEGRREMRRGHCNCSWNNILSITRCML